MQSADSNFDPNYYSKGIQVYCQAFKKKTLPIPILTINYLSMHIRILAASTYYAQINVLICMIFYIP